MKTSSLCKACFLFAISANFLVLFPASSFLFGQEQDISGTWTGDAIMPGSTEANRVTLVLEKTDDSSYKGRITDSRGLAKDAVLEGVSFQNGNLRSRFAISLNGKEISMRAGVNVLLGRLIGALWAENSPGTPLDLARSK